MGTETRRGALTSDDRACPVPPMATDISIGTQGWNYDAWVGPFYPAGTRSIDYLSIYARAFGTVEVDSTFYAVPPSRTVRGWAERTPEGFTFALKMPQEVTHERRLRGADSAAALFFERARELGNKLGPILLQMGPDFTPAELPALRDFLPLLPVDLRLAIEFRHADWIADDVLTMLAEHNVALALSDGRWIRREMLLPLVARPTSNFIYLRWMGPNRDIVDYSRVQFDRGRDLEAWALALATVPGSVTKVYGYVNNHFAGHSPDSARHLQRLLGQRTVEPSEMGEQMSLF